MNTKVLAALLAMIASGSGAPEKQCIIKIADFTSGKAQIIGELGIPIGQVTRVEATVVSADKIWPDSGIFQERYLLAIQTIDGRSVHDVFMPFQVHRYAVSKLFPGRIELGEELKDLLKKTPTAVEMHKAEAELFSSGKRSFLVYESVAFNGVPADMPPDVMIWSGSAFGPFSTLVVIKEMDVNK
ncbi:MAG: hypothetical protein ACOZE5_04770 [Verrucomicrobiota bacterium]